MGFSGRRVLQRTHSRLIFQFHTEEQFQRFLQLHRRSCGKRLFMLCYKKDRSVNGTKAVINSLPVHLRATNRTFLCPREKARRVSRDQQPKKRAAADSCICGRPSCLLLPYACHVQNRRAISQLRPRTDLCLPVCRPICGMGAVGGAGADPAVHGQRRHSDGNLELCSHGEIRI